VSKHVDVRFRLMVVVRKVQVAGLKEAVPHWEGRRMCHTAAMDRRKRGETAAGSLELCCIYRTGKRVHGVVVRRE